MGCSASKPSEPSNATLPPAPPRKQPEVPVPVAEPVEEAPKAPEPAPEPPKVEEPAPEPQPEPEPEPEPAPEPEPPKVEEPPPPEPEPPKVEEPPPPPPPEPEPQPEIVAVEEDDTNQAFGLLLCGAGESGKTTFTRQLKLKFLKGFTEAERVEFLRTIRGNIIDSMIELIRYAQSHDIQFNDDESNQYIEEIVDLDPFDTPFDEEIVEKLKHLWADPAIQEAFKHADETSIPDHMTYFFEKIEELIADDYIPSNEDVLKARIRTVGIDAITFDLEGAMIRIFDVGGQKSERSKWENVMEQVEGVIYCVSFADFDRMMFEDSNTSRIRDALNIFQSLTHRERFLTAPFFLVCNKFDVFKRKVETTDAFIKTFPEFQGDEHNAEACAEYLINQFLEVAKPLSDDRPIVPFKIVALNCDEVVTTATEICKFISEKYFAAGEEE